MYFNSRIPFWFCRLVFYILIMLLIVICILEKKTFTYYAHKIL